MKCLMELILIGIDIFIFKYIGFYPGIIFLVVISYIFLKKLGFLRKPGIFRGNFPEGVVFLKDYQGPFYKANTAFKEASNLIKTFQLKDYAIIAFYYDRPGEVEESKLRYSVGIYKKNKGFPDKPSGDLENHCKTNNYYYAELPNSSSLYSFWEYSNAFTLMLGIKKFYTILNNSLNDNDFRRTFKIQDKNFKIKVGVEVYESGSKMEFFIPLMNTEKFLLYKKDTKTE